MQISRISSTPAFKANTETTTEPKENVSIVKNGINTALVGGVAYKASKPVSTKLTDSVEQSICNFTKQFADDEAKLALNQIKENGEKGIKTFFKKLTKFNTNPIESLPKRGKAAIGYIILGALTIALTYIGVKDVDKDGQSDSIEALKKLINPA